MCTHTHVGGVHTRSASATERDDIDNTYSTSLMGETEPAQHVPGLMGKGSLFSGNAQSDGGLTALLT